MRQAVVVIHCIGEQRPMDTVREFADATMPLPSNPVKHKFWSEPNPHGLRATRHSGCRDDYFGPQGRTGRRRSCLGEGSSKYSGFGHTQGPFAKDFVCGQRLRNTSYSWGSRTFNCPRGAATLCRRPWSLFRKGNSTIELKLFNRLRATYTRTPSQSICKLSSLRYCAMSSTSHVP
jgi:hypothetical protein